MKPRAVIEQQPEAYKLVSTDRGTFIKVSNEDFDLVSQHSWTVDNGGYAITRIARKNFRMHQVILGTGLDHKNNDRLDNRRENLRIATAQQQGMNRTKSVGKSTGYKGVSLKGGGKYIEAYIQVDRKKRHLGYYSTQEDAARAYDREAKRLFGDFAKLNFPIDDSSVLPLPSA